MLEAKGQTADVRIHEDRIEIIPHGFFEKIQIKTGNTQTEIKLQDLAAVGFSKATMMVNGHIQFAPFEADGSFHVANTTMQTLNTNVKNVVNYTKKHLPEFEAIRAHLLKYLAENATGPAALAGGKVDSKDQIKAMKKLLDLGVISEAEFKENTINL
jgi:hypothetical protein